MERERYAALFDLAPDGYLVTDAGVIQEANCTAVALLAVSQEVLVGKPLVLWIAKEDRPGLSYAAGASHAGAAGARLGTAAATPAGECFPRQHYGWCAPEPSGTRACAILAPA